MTRRREINVIGYIEYVTVPGAGHGFVGLELSLDNYKATQNGTTSFLQKQSRDSIFYLLTFRDYIEVLIYWSKNITPQRGYYFSTTCSYSCLSQAICLGSALSVLKDFRKRDYHASGSVLECSTDKRSCLCCGSTSRCIISEVQV